MKSTHTRRTWCAAGLATTMALTSALMATTALAGPPKQGKSAAKGGGAAVITAGKKVYAANNCGACHTINGTGGKGGANLSHEGANPKHTAKWLETAIVKPTSIIPTSTMPSYADKIKGNDLKALVAYLSSLK